jgi:hypothetical protein
MLIKLLFGCIISCILLIIVMAIFVDPIEIKTEKQKIEEVVCTVVKFDGCEYIENVLLVQGVKNIMLTHKGNCSNPIHYQNKLEK